MTAQDKTYTLQSYETDFYTGTCNDGKQVVLGLLCPHIVAYFFDHDGNLLGKEQQLWKRPAAKTGKDGAYQIYDDDFVEAITEQIEAWLGKLGFVDDEIFIKPFEDKEMFVGTSEMPEYLEGADPTDEDDAESLESWKESGNYVFRWSKEYWVTASGEVEST